MTDDLADTPPGGWLAEPEHPALAGAGGARINDPARPDRLAWNTFRTLALWNTDIWVPSLLEAACGDRNPLSPLEWGEASVEFWLTDFDRPESVDVSLEGADAVVVVEASLLIRPTVDDLYRGMQRALDLAGHHGRQAGFVLVTPEADEDLLGHLDDMAEAGMEPLEVTATGLRPEAVAGAIGHLTWRDLAELALDLAEEGDDSLRDGQVRLLVADVQAAFPGLEV